MNWFRNLFIKDEPCKSCTVLHEAVNYERERNKELLETITSLLKPVVPAVNENPNQNLRAISPTYQTFTRKRMELERRDREEAERISRSSPHVAKADNEIEEPKPAESIKEELTQLEMELGLEKEAI